MRAADGPGAPEGQEPPARTGGELTEAVGSLLRVLVRRGREELERAASSGRHRLELRQLRRDRDVMYQKLGREVRSLVEGGEVSHPGVVRGVERIAELDVRIAEAESRAAEVEADAHLAAADSSGEGG